MLLFWWVYHIRAVRGCDGERDIELCEKEKKSKNRRDELHVPAEQMEQSFCALEH